MAEVLFFQHKLNGIFLKFPTLALKKSSGKPKPQTILLVH